MILNPQAHSVQDIRGIQPSDPMSEPHEPQPTSAEASYGPPSDLGWWKWLWYLTWFSAFIEMVMIGERMLNCTVLRRPGQRGILFWTLVAFGLMGGVRMMRASKGKHWIVRSVGVLIVNAISWIIILAVLKVGWYK